MKQEQKRSQGAENDKKIKNRKSNVTGHFFEKLCNLMTIIVENV